MSKVCHYLGLVLIDFFADSPYEVELEKDLSFKQQFLDVVVLRKRAGEFTGALPDGLDDLGNHNLITFKSHQEALDDWTVKELIGHYVSYRKQVSPPRQGLAPESEFRLYGVCARFPQNLASQVALEELQAGVYRLRWGTDAIRILVTRELPETKNNAVLHLFSAAPQRVRFGVQHYRRRSNDLSTVVNQLFSAYQSEGIFMPYTMEDFRRDYVREHLHDLTPEERLEGLALEERLKGLSIEQLEQLEQYLNKLKSRQAEESGEPEKP